MRPIEARQTPHRCEAAEVGADLCHLTV